MRRLLDALREDLGLTGTKEGCGEGECGACSVLSTARWSTAAWCRSARSTARASLTVEGLAPASGLDPLQQAFLETGGAQCGICTPGMLMAARAYLDQGGGPARRGHPRGDRRQPVPLHGLHQDHRRDRPRRRAEPG